MRGAFVECSSAGLRARRAGSCDAEITTRASRLLDKGCAAVLWCCLMLPPPAESNIGFACLRCVRWDVDMLCRYCPAGGGVAGWGWPNAIALIRDPGAILECAHWATPNKLHAVRLCM